MHFFRHFCCRMYRSAITYTAKNRTDEIFASGIAMDRVVTRLWLLQTRHFRRFGSAAIPMYVVRSMIGMLSNSYTLLVFYVDQNNASVSGAECVITGVLTSFGAPELASLMAPLSRRQRRQGGWERPLSSRLWVHDSHPRFGMYYVENSLLIRYSILALGALGPLELVPLDKRAVCVITLLCRLESVNGAAE